MLTMHDGIYTIQQNADGTGRVLSKINGAVMSEFAIQAGQATFSNPERLPAHIVAKIERVAKYNRGLAAYGNDKE